jgi:hypothetical protein
MWQAQRLPMLRRGLQQLWTVHRHRLRKREDEEENSNGA